MHISTVIKWAHRLLTLFLLILVSSFIWLNYMPDARNNDVLIHKNRINDHLWLYTTENRSGGATVPVVRRFYLDEDISGDDGTVLRKLNTETPFLAGGGSISKIDAITDEHITISYSGKVYALGDSVSYLAGGKQVNIRISWQIN